MRTRIEKCDLDEFERIVYRAGMPRGIAGIVAQYAYTGDIFGYIRRHFETSYDAIEVQSTNAPVSLVVSRPRRSGLNSDPIKCHLTIGGEMQTIYDELDSSHIWDLITISRQANKWIVQECKSILLSYFDRDVAIYILNGLRSQLSGILLKQYDYMKLSCDYAAKFETNGRNS